MAAFSPAYGFYDVTAYGADNTGMHDASVAIGNAESDCEKTGGVVYFPPGKYLLRTNPTINIVKSGVQWRGAGAGCSIILADPNGGNAPTVARVGSSAAPVTDISFRDLGFQGNGVNPGQGGPNLPVIAFGFTGFMPVSSCKVVGCNFTANTGPTVAFSGAAHGEVVSCNFSNVGYFNGSDHDPNVTPAVMTDNACTDIRVHHSYFESCQFVGVRVKATQSEVSSNFFDKCFASSITAGVDGGDGDDVRILSNYAQFTYEVQGGNQAIYIQHLKNYQAIGNIVHDTDGDGIAGGGCAAGICLCNISYDNCVKANDCGIQYIGQSAMSNQGICLIGNVCYNDRSSPRQQFGFRIFTQEGLETKASPIYANTFWGNVHDISIDNVLTPDSNISLANTTDWNDRLHETAYNPPNGLTDTTAKTSLLNFDLFVGANSVLLGARGIRIVASGSTIGTSTKSFFLGFGSSGNMMMLTGLSGGSQVKYWQLVAYVVDQSNVPGTGNTFQQYTMVQFWYDGQLKSTPPPLTPLIIDTTSQVQIDFEGQLSLKSDSIFCHFFSVERI